MSDLRTLRLQAIRDLLLHEEIGSQELLAQKLAAAGFACTQSSVSRDLADLGVSKSGGRYALPQAARLAALGIRSAKPAGPNLLVLRTEVGAAQLAAFQIDQMGIPEIVGTVAGDDTIFVATASRDDQAAVAALLGGAA